MSHDQPPQLNVYADAKPIDEIDGLTLALELVAAKQPGLSREEQLARAINIAGAVSMMETYRAGVADVRNKVDEIPQN
jgi:hypothetical protein